MNSFINALQHDHAHILNLFERARTKAWGSSEQVVILLEAKQVLLEHLEKEDTTLYPHLKRITNQKATAKRTLETFSDSITELTTMVTSFFNQLEGQSLSELEFSRVFGRIMGLLQTRIRREELYLYPLYKEPQESA
jgi:DUF438 domain-containing protein